MYNHNSKMRYLANTFLFAIITTWSSNVFCRELADYDEAPPMGKATSDEAPPMG